MASKSFSLTESPEGGGGACAKLCVCTCILALVGIIGVVGVYIYQATYGGSCSYPELDENGLSNWTSGSDQIVFACFPGYFLEGNSNLLQANCEKGVWNPEPPACHSLPLRIDCQVHNQSLTGNITMWQQSSSAPTHIYGQINYTEAIKPQGHLMEYVMMSKRTCNVSHVIPRNISETYPEPEAGSKILTVKFSSTDLKAYRKADLYLNMIFVDKNTTATLITVHQEKLTLVMESSSNPGMNSTHWNWMKEVENKKEVRMHRFHPINHTRNYMPKNM